MASRRRKAVDVALGRFIERAMRRLTLRVWQVLTVETPVRFGFARAGWSPTTGAPDRSSPTDAPTNENLARTQASALLATHRQAAEALASGYKLRSGPVFIVNNVRYVVFLNRGTSEQAPQMFVEMGIALAVRAAVADLSG